MTDNKNNSFVHLQVRSEYTLLDSSCRLAELVERAKALGQKAAAVTDRGVMYGAVEFYKLAKKNGIKPIIGCELTVSTGTVSSAVILLCENEEGYYHLIKLVSDAAGGDEGCPSVTKELLRKYSRGLICLDGGMNSFIAGRAVMGDESGARAFSQELMGIFGRENYYIRLEDHFLGEERRVIPHLVQLAEDIGAETVACNDVRYTLKEDSQVRTLLACIGSKKTIFEANGLKLSNDEYYLKSGEEMYALFKQYPSACENTVKIAKRCNLELTFGELKLPRFDAQGESTAYFRRLCAEGLKKRYPQPSEAVTARMRYEISVIEKMGYTDYFLIVWEFVNYAREHDIPVGPGRGSGAGSLCAYCLGITDIDPIKYDLIFERFLNPERVSMPDFDIDFCALRRQRVVDHVIKRYGRDKVSQIVAFNTLKARAAVQDAGRALNISPELRSAVAAFIPKKPDASISEALKNDRSFSELYSKNASVRRLVDAALRIEGLPRNETVHAPGVVISGVPITDLVPVKKHGSEMTVTQYPKKALESLGLLKMDFLELRNLTVIKMCTDEIMKAHPEFDPDSIPEDDSETFEMMSRGGTIGVFQFESDGIRRLLTKMKPHCIEDLIAALALYRPGPMDSISVYLENRLRPESIRYKHPLLEKILRVTYGCIVYQEQVMEIFRSLAGYSLGRADLVRRAMAAKDHSIMENERNSFIYGDSGSSSPCIGCMANGIDEETANSIFDEMSSFASYAFNKSHAAAYAVLSYRTAYLKRHYTREYMAALMTYPPVNSDKIPKYAEECRLMGVRLLPPDINRSLAAFTPEKDGIRFGFCGIKGVRGADEADGSLRQGISSKIILERENGSFKGFEDFCVRMTDKGLGRLTAENLIKSGAFDGLGLNRHELILNFENITESVSDRLRSNVEGQLGLFGDIENEKTDGVRIRHAKDYSSTDKLFLEKEATGIFVSGHPVSEYETALRLMRVPRASNLARALKEGRLKNGRELYTCGIVVDIAVKGTSSGGKMCFITLQDTSGEVRCTVFSEKYSQFKSKLKAGAVLYVCGRANVSDRYGSSFTVDVIFDEEELVRIISEKRLCIKLAQPDRELIERIVSAALKHSGSIGLCLYIKSAGKYLVPKNIRGVSADSALVRELSKCVDISDIGLIDDVV